MKSLKCLRLACVAVAAKLLSCSSVFAGGYAWTGFSGLPFPPYNSFLSNDNWSNPANWSGLVVPTSSNASDITFIDGSPRLTPNQDLANPFLLHSMTFNGSGYTLGGQPIALVSAPFIQQNNGSVTIANPLVLQSTTTYDGPGDATLSGVISGSAGLIKNGPGKLTLNASNTFTGTTQINAGQVVLGTSDALVKSTVVINANNGLNLNGQDFPTIGNLSGSGNLYLGDYDVNNAARLFVGGNNASPAPYSGTITSGPGRWMEKVGTGTLTLSGSGSSFFYIQIADGSVILSGGRIATALHLGDFGNSTPLTIQNGAIVDSRGLDISSVDGSSTLRVTGAGTIWRAGDARIAWSGGTSGNAIVEAGAAVTDATNFIVGQGGAATLLLQTGGTINASIGIIGQNSAASATATVTGPGSVWTNTSSLSLGGQPTVSGGGTGTLNVSNGGAVITIGTTNLWTATSSITVNGATLTTGSLAGGAGAGTINLTDPSGGVALTINGATGTASYGGNITGTGSVVKSGGSTQALTGTLTYLGTTTVNGGVLQISQPDLGSRSFRANPGGTIAYKAPFITGGFLRGGGVHDLSAVTRLQATTFAPDVSIAQNNPLILLNVTTGGAISNDAPLTLDGFLLTSAGRLTVNDTVTSQALESDGLINIVGKGILNNSGTLVLGGGSRTFVGDSEKVSGELSVAGGTLDLNGALLVNNGRVSGTTNVNYGSLAKGSGRYGDVNVTDGGRFSPGNSPGSVTTGSTTWNSGGNYLVEIVDALAGSGTGWDRWNINGALHLNATSSTDGRFTISLSTLDALAVNFDNTHDYTWPILRASDGIVGFDASELTLDTLGFKNNLGGGHFTIENSNSDLVVRFSAVPEPAVMGLVAVAAGVARRRRR